MDGSPRGAKKLEATIRTRILGKLRNKGENVNTAEEVAAFLYGPTDKLTPGAPPNSTTLGLSPISPVSPFDVSGISSSTQLPQGAGKQSSEQAKTPLVVITRKGKGLVVRFTDDAPVIIGEGGEEADLPTSEISSRKASKQSAFAEQIGSQDPPSRVERAYSRSLHQAEGLAHRKSWAARASGEDLFDEFRALEMSSNHGQRVVQEQAGSGQESKADADSLARPSTADSRLLSFAARMDAQLQAKGGQEGSLASREGSSERVNDSAMLHLPPGTPTPDSDRTEKTPLIQSPHFLGQPQRPMSATATGSPPTTSRVGVDPYPASSTTSSPPKTSLPALPRLADSPEENPLQEFSDRVSHLDSLFHLSTTSIKPISAASSGELCRVALWWFLKGRRNMEASIREGTGGLNPQAAIPPKRQQAYADLAKALWAVQQINPRNDCQGEPKMIDAYSASGELLEVTEAVLSNLRKLVNSMKRNNLLPPSIQDSPLPRGLDCSIWVPGQGNRSLLNREALLSSKKRLYDSFPLGDSSRFFLYYNMFVESQLIQLSESQDYRCPCLVSLVRYLGESTLTLTVASQDGAINISIQADKSQGLTWEDLSWRADKDCIDIVFSPSHKLRLHCLQQDFRGLWMHYDYHNRIQGTLQCNRDETICYDRTVKVFQYFDQDPNSQIFSKEPLADCHVRCFEKTISIAASTGHQESHRGFRIVVVTGRKTKSLRAINQNLLPITPLQFAFMRGTEGSPALMIKMDDGRIKSRIVLTFDDPAERLKLHSRLTGTHVHETEVVHCEGTLQSMSITGRDPGGQNLRGLDSIRWQRFRTIQENDMRANKPRSSPLRILLDFEAGSIVDRMSFGPGDLQLRLDVASTNELKILRQPQEDMTISILEGQTPQDLAQQLTEVLRNIRYAQTIRTYAFHNLAELHFFQTAITGFTVLYDSTVASFNISRRRSGVPIHRHWECTSARIQVLRRDKVVQLVAFFENFNHGDCMNFVLKETDNLETSSRGGKFLLRMLDAKFALPKISGEGDPAVDSRFVCLDLPDYPGEHDDIAITFDTQIGMPPFLVVLRQ